MRIVLVSALALMATPAFAEQSPKEQVLGKIMSAYVLEQTCPRMRVDTVAVGKKLAELGLSPADIGSGGRYHQMLVDHATHMRMLDKMQLEAGKTPAELAAFNCRNASEFYGPSGWILKGMMVPR